MAAPRPNGSPSGPPPASSHLGEVAKPTSSLLDDACRSDSDYVSSQWFGTADRCHGALNWGCDVDDDTDIDELGPVDWIVVEFPGSKFNGEIAPALADLVERDLIRVLDLLILKKEADGTLEAFELSDLDEAEIGGLRSHEAELAMLLSEEDVNAVAAAVEPGSSAAVLVWENTWAAPFGAAIRRAGGQLVASGRIPIQAMLAAIEADDEDDDQEEA
jgi:hypothetical protein